MKNPILLNSNDLKPRIDAGSVVVVDTRDPQSYQAGHIPGAVNMPSIFSYLATLENGGLASLVETFAHTLGDAGITARDSVVFYENTLNSGYGQSCRGYFILKYLGHSDVAVLQGGFKEWTDAGFPVSRDAVIRPATIYEPALNPEMIVTLDQMKDVLDNERIVKLDCRDEEEWVGLSSSPYGRDFAPRKGRIPGAVWIEWTKFMNAQSGIPQFADDQTILSLCESVGIYPDTPVYVYCFKGSRSSNTMLALQKAGIRNVRNYFGSWNEWSRDPSARIDDQVLGQGETTQVSGPTGSSA